MVVSRHILEHLSQILANLGLIESEIKVFTYLLQSNVTDRISTIAQRTKLNRTTLYGVLKSLSAKGLVTSVDDGGILTYRSIQPHLLVDYIERAQHRLSQDIEKVREIIPSVEELRRMRGRAQPSIQFFHGAEGLKQAYDDTLRNNASRKILGFIGTDTVVSGFSIEMAWNEYYMERRKQAGIKFYAIATASKNSPHWLTARDKKDGRVTKVLPKGYDFGIEIAMYENKVLFASFAEEDPLGVLIEDVEISKAMREIHRYIDSTLQNSAT